MPRRSLAALAVVGFVLYGLSRLHADLNLRGLVVSPMTQRVDVTPSVRQDVVKESAPSAQLEDSLVEGVRYAATAVGAGFNNQLIGYIMLLQYAREAGRVPILGDFIAASNGNIQSGRSVAPYLPFESVFDLEAYAAATSQAVTTFGALKTSSSRPETIQCFASSHRSEQSSLHGVTAAVSLGISWSTAEGIDMDVWDAPPSIDVAVGCYLDMADLIAFSEDPVQWTAAVNHATDARKAAEDRKEVDPRQSSAVPSQQLACWTDLFWSIDTADMDERWTVWPAWDAAGTHLRFAPTLERLAGEYLRQVLGDQPQPFIAIHARHGDFGCPEESDPAAGQEGASCFRSPASYLPTIEVFRSRLAEEQNVEVSANAVVVFSDETDEHWWSKVAAMGWQRINHSEFGTARRFDNWWPTLIDMVLMSQAKGFIGTLDSTYSLLAARRVVDWQQGLVTLEKR